MNNATFEQVVEELLSRCRETLNKRKELYAPNENRLENFGTQAMLKDETLLQALAGNAAKHTVTFYSLINRAAVGEDIKLSQWQETLIDEINYRLLAYAAVIDEEG